MVKFITLLISSFLSVAVMGQEKIQIIAGDSPHYLIGLNFSPDYSFRTLSSNDGSSGSNTAISAREKVEVPKLGYTFGINFSFVISKHFAIETGIQYSNKGYQTKKWNVVLEQPQPGSTAKAKTIYSSTYLDIPLKANFIFGKNKLRFFSSAGFSTNIFLNNKVVTHFTASNGKIYRNKITPSYKNKMFNISPLVSIGIDYKINSKLSFTIEPTFRYGIIKIMETPVSEYLWNAGLNTGIRYSFN